MNFDFPKYLSAHFTLNGLNLDRIALLRIADNNSQALVALIANEGVWVIIPYNMCHMTVESERKDFPHSAIY